MSRVVMLTLLAVPLLFSLSQPAVAQQTGELSYRDESVMPAGMIGQRIQSLIATFNSGDPGQVRRFLEEECTAEFRDYAPMEEHFSVFASIKRQWGGIDFHSIRSYDPPRPDETVVILKDHNLGAWRAFTLRFGNSAEQLISGISFNDARTPSNVSAPPLTEAGFVQAVNTLVERACSKDVLSGTVLVARGDDVLLTHACGEASKRFHVPINVDTRFNLGSMNKMFTSTAIMQLVEQGVVSVDEPIGTYVDTTWLPREVTDKITIHHLLTHMSGLGSYFNDLYWRTSRLEFRELDDYKPLVRMEELAFEPGTEYAYSNTGMFLLGVVLESATGENYFDYIRKHIYAPAGMSNSDSYDMDRPVENLAIGYHPDADSEFGWENNIYLHVVRGGPAGGGFSTVGDLHRFAQALLAGKLVSQESLDRMWTDHSGEGYGYGFGLSMSPNGRVVGHGGGFPGINANLQLYLDRGYVVAVMSNYSDGALPISRQIATYLMRVPTGDD
jgi:CubicO group peptidase (beta-lactamase class C family)